MTCVAAFLAPPQLQLGYVVGGGPTALSTSLPLPLVVTKFCRKPDNPVSAEVFFSRWRAIAGGLARETIRNTAKNCQHAGPPYKLSEAVSRVTPLLPAAIQELLDGLHLAVQHGIDTDPANFVAVGTLSHGPPSAPVQVPLMLRLEVEKVQRLRFQVTVASNEVVATSAVKDVVCKLLATV